MPIAYGRPREYDGQWTVDAWLADSPYPSTAHRGAPNGTTRAEFSWDAYDYAWAKGFRSLELSAHRTSDGVWVLSHDATTGAQYTTDLTIATSTWATLQTLTRKYGVTTEPMRRLDETLARYPNAIFFIENKTYGNYTTFHAILTAIPNFANRIVHKNSGDANPSFALAIAAGFKYTWAYYFGTAGAALLPTEWDPNMKWVGLSSGPTNNATDQVWFDWCKNHNPPLPIKGHIVRGSPDWASMKAQGAVMGMINDASQFPLS